MAKSFYEADGGIIVGNSYMGRGVVFPGTEALDEHFADTDGKADDADETVLYHKVDRKRYREYLASIDHSLVSGAPRGVVGFEPTGEDSLVPTQKVDGSDDADADLLEADKASREPVEGDPVPLDSAEAERRVGAPDGVEGGKTENASGVDGGAGVAPSVEENPESKADAPKDSSPFA